MTSTSLVELGGQKAMEKLVDAIANSKIGNMVDRIYMNMLYYRSIGRPKSILLKNNQFMVHHLLRNEGNGDHSVDGYGTPIGLPAQADYNSFFTPWFITDPSKSSTANYLQYVNSTYFDGNGGIVPYIGLNQSTVPNYSYQNLNLENNKVGAVRNYDYVEASAQQLHPNGLVKPGKSGIDTKTGLIDNFFLSNTIQAAKEEYDKSGNYTTPTYGDKGEIEKQANANAITLGAYSKFGLDGEYGLKNGEKSLLNGRVHTQSEFVGDVIPWSTTDHFYNSETTFGNSSTNEDFVKKLLNTDSDLISQQFQDITQGVNNKFLYGGFGNFYSFTYSQGLWGASSHKTRNFISRAMLGIDMLDSRPEYNNITIGDYKDGDVSFGNVAKRKYYVGSGTRGTNYIDKMTSNDVKYVFEHIEELNTDAPIRVLLMDAGNDNLWSNRTLYSYAEAEGKSGNSPLINGTTPTTYNIGTDFGSVVAYDLDVTSTKPDLINYTNQRFLLGKFGTLIGRFHTDGYESRTEARAQNDPTSTAISEYGMSMGRNLLRAKHGANNKARDGEGYDNPYCRVWTFHHQYSKVADLIRPFADYKNNDNEASAIGQTRERTTALSQYGVKTSTGLVRYAPTAPINDKDAGIKRCMFSLENLAWKNEKLENPGPNGGRIMWFPPYDLKFSEQVNVNWQPNQFIGRGERIYTYTDTERGGNLSFTLLIDHPQVVNSYAGPIRGGDGIGDVDDTESSEQMLLRFFAGCEVLLPTAGAAQAKKKKSKEVKVQDVEIQKTTKKKICFYVFYPNNYSGKDDSATGPVKPIVYLLDGVSAQKTYNSRRNDIDTPIDKTTTYTLQSGGEDIIGGYETRNSGNTFTGTVYDNSGNSIELSPMVRRGKDGKTKRWWYRVDEWLSNEVLHKPIGKADDANYSDSTSFQLNSLGYSGLTEFHTDAKKYLDDNSLFSLCDVYCALEDNIETTRQFIGCCANTDNVKTLKSNFSKYEVSSVEVCGYASSHGYKENNKKLALNRAKTIMAWLKTYSKLKDAKINATASFYNKKLKHQDVNELDAKVYRCARCIITFEVADVATPAVGIDNINHFDNKTKRAIDAAVGFVRDNGVTSREDDLFTSQNFTNVQKVATNNQIEVNQREANAEAAKVNKAGKFSPEPNTTSSDDEYKYFKDLERNDPFLHKRIVEKLQYFDPAFHSITPEGFNARLTFLQQCTRQGPTTSASEVGNELRSPANNLAFGAPPVCVLRIGDFFNTKIIVESLNIRYDNNGIQWDLNDEGIGVSPMYATVDMTFKFVGGSDLSGPIKRLQNAVSFNYYANTSVYEKRAETNIEEVEPSDEDAMVETDQSENGDNKVEDPKSEGLPIDTQSV